MAAQARRTRGGREIDVFITIQSVGTREGRNQRKGDCATRNQKLLRYRMIKTHNGVHCWRDGEEEGGNVR